MPLTMLGLSHESAALDLLERAAVRPGGCGPLLVALLDVGCTEAVVLSTCSRTELYVVGEVAPAVLEGVLAAHCGVDVHAVAAVARTRVGGQVPRHLFAVAGGLRSRVLGEPEIHGQVRAALAEAQALGAAGPVLTRLFGTAVRCGREVRERTTLGGQGRSLACRAVDVGLATLAPGTTPVVAVVGAGRMAAAAVERLATTGLRATVVARDRERAARLVPATRVREIADLVAVLVEADLVICATSASADLVRLQDVRTSAAERVAGRALTLVDLSLPRTVEPLVATLPGVRLVGLDDLGDDPLAARAAAVVAAAETVVAACVEGYEAHLGTVAAGPAIQAMHDAVRATCRRELRSAGTITDDQIERIAHKLAGQLLHRPILAARAAARAGDDAALDEVTELFSAPAPRR